MIYVTVGTTAFEGLVRAADNLNTKDEVLIQKADGKYVPKNKKYYDFSQEHQSDLDRAEVVVTHGGAGTLFKLIGSGKRVVGVANEERTDLHQRDILKKLSDEGHVIWCRDLDLLSDCIAEAKKKEPKKYQKPECEISKTIITRFV